jgi:hypothetical protein
MDTTYSVRVKLNDILMSDYVYDMLDSVAYDYEELAFTTSVRTLLYTFIYQLMELPLPLQFELLCNKISSQREFLIGTDSNVLELVAYLSVITWLFNIGAISFKGETLDVEQNF